MRCDFQLTDDPPDSQGWRLYQCSRDGCKQKTSPTPHGPSRIFATCKVIGLGDYVTYYLSLFGLTKHRVEWFTGKPCGCEERREKINTWGEWIKGLWRRA